MTQEVLDELSRPEKKYIRGKKKKWQFRYRFVDKIRYRAEGGRGGRGCLSHKGAGRMKLHPDGGHGGAGGSIIIVADKEKQSLRMSTNHGRAPNGSPGSSSLQRGKSGDNLIVRVPCGVIVKRVLDKDQEWDDTNKCIIREEGYSPPLDFGHLADDGEFGEEEDTEEVNAEEEDEDFDVIDRNDGNENINFAADGEKDDDWDEESNCEEDDDDDMIMEDLEERPVVNVSDLDHHGAYVVVARGGSGGIGTLAYAGKHPEDRPDAYGIFRNASPELGEVAFLELELKLIADIGLVGFPNAGKSSLLRAMSRAVPKVAPYPFTTLHPLLGTVEYRDGFQIRAADIPGLIAGASQGRGCGHEFLRHIERTKALLYIVDAAGTDGRDPHEDLRVLANELHSYGQGDLLERRAIVLANKIDLLDPERVPELLFSLAEVADGVGIQRDYEVHGASVGVTGEGLAHLSRSMRDVVGKVEQDRVQQLEQQQMEG